MDIETLKTTRNTLVLIACFSFAGATHAQQNKVVYAATDPYQGQFRVKTSEGTLIVADGSTDRIYVSSPDGTVKEVSFNQAAAATLQDPTSTAQALSDFRASLNDQSHLVTVTYPRIATDSRIWITPPKMCGEHICLIEDPIGFGHPEGSAVTTSSCNHYLCPNLQLPCDLGPCSPNSWSDGLMFYTGFKAGWGDNEGGGNVTQQQLLTYDKTRFEQSRAGACTDKNIKATGTIGAGAAVAATCMTSPSGVGAVACAGAVLAYAIGLYETNRSSKQCQASYPGIGNW